MQGQQYDRDCRETHRAILEWLCPVDSGSQQSDFAARRQKGTGQWLLQTTEFEDWLSEPKQTLFCHRPPGTGKTIITTAVVNHLNAAFPGDIIVGVAYLYFNFRRQEEQKTISLLACLLKQLVQEQSHASEKLKELYNATRTEERAHQRILF